MIHLKQRFYEAYLVFVGRVYDIPSVQSLQQNLLGAEARYRTQLARANLAAELYNESEIGRKATSDNLGDKIIGQMRSDPSRFLPPKEDE